MAMQAPEPRQERTPAAGEHRLLQRYFAEIGPIPVLSAGEEAALARRLREAEEELRALLEPLPFTAQAFVARWRTIVREGRVTGQLSRTHEPPARDRSAAVDRIARQVERALAEREALLRRSARPGPALARVERRIAAGVRAAELRPELLHELLGELRAQGTPSAPAETLAAAEAAEQRGRAAKDTFVRHNLRLVVHQAKAFRNYGVPFLDLIQEGTLGLIRAVEKFDERLGNRFSTYAIWWIQQSCMRAVQQISRTVRLPAPVQDEIRRYRRTVEQLAARGPSPAASEIGRALGLAAREVDGIAKLERGALRLDDPIPGHERGSFADRLVDGRAGSDEAVDRGQLEQRVADLLATLPSRDRTILYARFGFAGEEQTLQELAARLGLSRERVRQLEQRALARLAAAAREAGLEAWLAGGAFSG
jgi:RNA polymerase primary sigma factor/RNA polymerase nonessential primary-like sigma factor